VVAYVDPDNSGWWGKAVFYVSFFFLLSGFMSLVLATIRKKTFSRELADANTKLSMRQGMLLATLAIALLVLQSFRMLVWWDGLLVVAGIFLVELYFLSRN
jgi:hypothetical protein